MLKSQPGTNEQRRLLTVIGPSGSGKSSVVLAGLLPQLKQSDDSSSWVYLNPMVPGKEPIKELADVFRSTDYFRNTSFETLQADLKGDTIDGLHRLAKQLATQQVRITHQQTRVVLFVDQFEELFTLTGSEERRRCFLDLLRTAVTEPEGPLLVLLTLRADFYHRLMEYPDFYELIDPMMRPLLPLGIEELRAAIERPAAHPDVQLVFEGNLVGDLLFEVQGQAGALPLLQFTLRQLFERRTGHRLTQHAYKEIGKVSGALAKYADETYEHLPKEQKSLARVLFLRLLEPGVSEQETTRRRAALTEFAFEDQDKTRRMQETMDVYVKARLLTINTNERVGTATIEVGHEALIREWPLLVRWLREARENIRLQQTISKDATEWEQRNKPGDRLYRGTQLKEARAWASCNAPGKIEDAFLRASTARRRRHVVSRTASVLLVLLALILTAVALVRPSWCSAPLCPPPRAVTNLQGVHDANLDLYLIAIQSTAYVIPGSPAQFSLDHLPESIGAMRTDGQAIDSFTPFSPYQVALGVHSLQQVHGIVIEQVALIVRQASALSYPLNVWVIGSRYTAYNIYQVNYRRQGRGATLFATYSLPGSHVQLAPGEGDSLVIQVISHVPIQLQFALQVTYRVITESQSPMLTLRQVFKIAFFAASSSWHLYRLQDGHFIKR